MLNLLYRLAVVGITCVATMAAASAATVVPVGGATNHATIWVPDYYGRTVNIYKFDYTVNPATFKITRMNLAPRNCNPNSVTLHGGLIYVVCNSDFDGLDQILVYSGTRLTYVRAITGVDIDGNQYFDGASLIGILFDAHGNLWTTGYNTNTLLRVPAANLTQTNPRIDREVIDSPDSPAGLAMGGDHSIWVVGQFQGGIVLNFTDAVLNQPGSFLQGNPLNPSPRYCISNNAPGCQQITGLFDQPEGVAIYGGAAWVTNNGGNAPGKTMVRLTVSDDELSAITYGGTQNRPFACPGGIFAAVGTNKTETLWVNDEGFGVAGTDCGASNADQSANTGLVMEFLPQDLTLPHKSAPPIYRFSYESYLRTSSPGFGGIFVQLD